MLIVMFDVVVDCLLQLRHALEHAAPNPWPGDFGEPPLDQVPPRTARRREVHRKSWMTRAPPPDPGMFVRRVIVDDPLQVDVLRRARVDLLKKLDPLLLPMPLFTRGQDVPCGDVERGAQRRRAVPYVIVSHRESSSSSDGINRQTLLRAIQGLNLRLFIDTELDRAVRRIQI